WVARFGVDERLRHGRAGGGDLAGGLDDAAGATAAAGREGVGEGEGRRAGGGRARGRELEAGGAGGAGGGGPPRAGVRGDGELARVRPGDRLARDVEVRRPVVRQRDGVFATRRVHDDVAERDRVGCDVARAVVGGRVVRHRAEERGIVAVAVLLEAG